MRSDYSIPLLVEESGLRLVRRCRMNRFLKRDHPRIIATLLDPGAGSVPDYCQ